MDQPYANNEYMISIEENTLYNIVWYQLQLASFFIEKLTVLLQNTITGARIVLRLGLLLWWILLPSSHIVTLQQTCKQCLMVFWDISIERVPTSVFTLIQKQGVCINHALEPEPKNVINTETGCLEKIFTTTQFSWLFPTKPANSEGWKDKTWMHNYFVISLQFKSVCKSMSNMSNTAYMSAV